jgi:glutamate racemase
MRERFRDLPVIGVVEPGAKAAVMATRSGCIAVIGTEATVRGGAYQRAIARRRPDATVTALACQLFVALAEEGWTSGEVARATAQRYLVPLFGSGAGAMSAPVVDTLVLGCTHFPMLRTVIREVVGNAVTIVDSAATTASAARALLSECGLLCLDEIAAPVSFLATDGGARFAAIGARFLGCDIDPRAVELIDL